MTPYKYSLVFLLLITILISVLTGCAKTTTEKVNEPIYDNTNYLSHCWATATTFKPKDEILSSTGPTLIKKLLEQFISINTLEKLSNFSFYTVSNYTENIESENYSAFGQINPKFLEFYSPVAEDILTNNLLIKLTSNYFNTYYKDELLIYSTSYEFLESYSKKDATLNDYQSLLSEKKSHLFILPKPIEDKINDSEIPSKTKEAYLFWIRRYTDSTASNLYSILSNSLNAFKQ